MMDYVVGRAGAMYGAMLMKVSWGIRRQRVVSVVVQHLLSHMFHIDSTITHDIAQLRKKPHVTIRRLDASVLFQS